MTNDDQLKNTENLTPENEPIQEQEENLVWAYEQPFPEVAELHGHVAFYENRVDIESFR